MLLYTPFSASARPPKRQKTEGMNSRYDKMIQTVNMMHGPPHHRGSDRRTRNRAMSSSSATSHELAKTPVQDNRKGGWLGPSFSALKMRTSGPSASDADMFGADAFSTPGSSRQSAIERLPPWLEGTISSLDLKHPLRVLAPDVPAACRDSSPSALDFSSDSLLTPAEDSPFAFTAPTKPIHRESRDADLKYHYGELDFLHSLPEPSVLQYNVPRDTCGDILLSTTSPRIRDPERSNVGPSMRPFSTPGPASTLDIKSSHAPPPLLRSNNGDWHVIPVEADLGTDLDVFRPPPAFLPFSTPGPLSDLAPAHSLTYIARSSTPSDSSSTHPPPRVIPLSSLPSPPRSTAPRWGTRTPPLFSHILGGVLSVPPSASRWRISSGEMKMPSVGYQPYATPGPIYASRSCLETHGPTISSSSPVHSGLYRDEPQDEQLPQIHLSARRIEHIQPEEGSVHDALDFKWERYDRGQVSVGSSSSPIHHAPESEETFWSQPVQPVYNTTNASGIYTSNRPAPPTSRQGGSSHSVLLSPICSPGYRAEQHQSSAPPLLDNPLPKTPLSQSYAPPERVPSPLPDNEDGMFAWIVPPRDLPPPSTPRRRVVDSLLRSMPNSSMSRPPKPSEAPQADHAYESRRISVGRAGSSFAPATGVYVSPLRGENFVSQSMNVAPPSGQPIVVTAVPAVSAKSFVSLGEL
ncbi:hypothetical protein BC628DRAFT_803595 [Trametes gibbosa]|nr:hypothetical protein BC628DRAFT_803595 [Trametes gibbosa]